MLKLTVLVSGVLLAITGAHAAEVKPIQAVSINLQQVHGVAYYTVEPAGYRVVASVAVGEDSTPMQITAVLADGQRLLLSVPGALNAPATELELIRNGERLSVSAPPISIVRSAE